MEMPSSTVLFDVQGDLASKPVAPRDAASMQSAENQVIGQTQRGGPAAVMQSAADVNVRCGLVGPDAVTDVVADQGVAVAESNIGGTGFVTERVGGQTVGQYVEPRVPATPGSALDITIGEALEATALSAGDKPIDQGDAAAICAAEVRATGSNEIALGGVASRAQSAAALNARVMRDENKTTLSDVLANATTKLRSDKAATREDAPGVIGAEIRNKPDMSTAPSGVAASVAAAARLRQKQ